MTTIPLADEVDLECGEPEQGCVQVGVDGLWHVDECRLSSFAERLDKLINEYLV